MAAEIVPVGVEKAIVEDKAASLPSLELSLVEILCHCRG